jgi:hypothetical protein
MFSKSCFQYWRPGFDIDRNRDILEGGMTSFNNAVTSSWNFKYQDYWLGRSFYLMQDELKIIDVLLSVKSTTKEKKLTKGHQISHESSFTHKEN